MHEDLKRDLAAMRAKHLQWLADQAPTLTRLKAALEEEHVIQQMDAKTLRDFCAKLEAKYGVDHGRDT